MEYFSFLEKFGSIPGLERVGALLGEWGNPQKKMKVVLVGGTNGKGSVTAMLSSVLREQGFGVGAFYSPHLLRFNERIVFNGKEIGDGEIRKYEGMVREWVDRGKVITYFEAVTASAYHYFAKKGAEYAVMEIGMGGRLDAANIAEEALSVITNISPEHTRWLGETEKEIAFEKAGIMKKGPAVTGAGIGLEVIEREARKRKLPLRVYGEDFECNPLSVTSSGSVFDYSGEREYTGLGIPLIGKHQMKNAGLAVCGAEVLGCSEDAVRKGLGKAKMRGRLEVLSKEPLVVADVAHNPAGAWVVRETVPLFGREKVTIVFGCMKDKDWKDMVKSLGEVASGFIFTKPGTERAEDPEKLAKEGRKYCPSSVVEEPGEAVKIAVEAEKEDGLIIVTGSFYMMREVYEALAKA